MNQQRTGTPGITTALSVFGGFAIVAGVVIIFVGLGEAATVGAGVALTCSSVIFFGFASIVDRLHAISENTAMAADHIERQTKLLASMANANRNDGNPAQAYVEPQ